MSVKHVNMIFSCEHIKDRGEFCVLMALAYLSDDSGICETSVPLLAQQSRLTERGVRKVLSRLKSVYVEWSENDGGRNRTNRYKLLSAPLNPEPGSGFSAEKGEPRSGFNGTERVNSVQGLGEKGELSSGFSAEKGELSSGFSAEKGEPGSGFSDDGLSLKKLKPPPLTPPPRISGRGGGGFFDSVLSERDAPFRTLIAEVLDSYPDNDHVALAKDQLGWRTCRRSTQKQLLSIAGEYGFEIYTAAVVMAAAEPSLKSPLSFIRSVCERLEAQRIDYERRQRLHARQKAPVQQVQQTTSGDIRERMSELYGIDKNDPDYHGKLMRAAAD